MLEWLAQYLVNYVKAKEYKIINDISEGVVHYPRESKRSWVRSRISNDRFEKFKRKSREAAMDARDRCVYSPYWHID